MLWTIFVVLLVLWFLGLVTSYTLGGFIHILLIIAIAVVLIRIIQGRRPVYPLRGGAAGNIRCGITRRCLGHLRVDDWLGAQLLQSGDHALDRVQMIDDPVGINEVTDRHTRGSARVAIMRSA